LALESRQSLGAPEADLAELKRIAPSDPCFWSNSVQKQRSVCNRNGHRTLRDS
jgi:hypothetical protein